MKKLLLIPLLLFCVTAFGQWTKPQLYTNINTNIRLKTYSPTRMAALLDSLVATMGTGDMVLASTQTNSGAKTFLDGTFKLRNVANTFNAIFSNTNTSDQTYTLPDFSGPLALNVNGDGITANGFGFDLGGQFYNDVILDGSSSPTNKVQFIVGDYPTLNDDAVLLTIDPSGGSNSFSLKTYDDNGAGPDYRASNFEMKGGNLNFTLDSTYPIGSASFKESNSSTAIGFGFGANSGTGGVFINTASSGEDTGDLLQRKSDGYLGKISAVSAGSFLRSGGVSTLSSWSTVKLPNTMSALGLWVANSANTTVNLTAAANQSIRVNAGGTAWEAFTPGTGSIGGSTGATDNSILRADGTGGATLQNSGLVIDDSANLTLGVAALAGATRTIQADGSASDVAIQVLAKGSSDATLGSVGTGRAILSAGGGWQLNAWNFTSGAVPTNNIFGNSTSSTNANNAGDLLIRAGGTTSTVANRSGSVTIASGIGNGTNSASGDVFIDIGATTGSGLDGNIGLLTNSVANWQAMERGIFEGNALTAPTGNPSSGLFRYVSSSEPEGSNMIVRTSGGHLAKPVLVKKITISGGATLRGIGSTPQTIIDAPGSNKYINVMSITVSYNYVSAVYDFSGTEIPVFEFSGATDAQFRFTTGFINAAADGSKRLSIYNPTVPDYNMQNLPSNTAFVLTTDDGGDATTGDGDLDIVVYYTIEDTNQ